jgi:hypothetical protein
VLRTTSLEWTQFHNGLFLDYFGMPHIETHLTPLVIFVDIAHRMAAIPGGAGGEKITFTYTKDLAKFVVASLGLEEWDEVLRCYSEQASLEEIVRYAEEVTGKYGEPVSWSRTDSVQATSSQWCMIPLRSCAMVRSQSCLLIRICISTSLSHF